MKSTKKFIEYISEQNIKYLFILVILKKAVIYFKLSLFKMEIQHLQKLKKVTLSKLYKTDLVKDLVWAVLSEEYENRFNRLVTEAHNIRSLLANSAKQHKTNIKGLFIEYGYNLETLEDLKKCLDDIKTYDTVDECDSATMSQEEISQV